MGDSIHIEVSIIQTRSRSEQRDKSIDGSFSRGRRHLTLCETVLFKPICAHLTDNWREIRSQSMEETLEFETIATGS